MKKIYILISVMVLIGMIGMVSADLGSTRQYNCFDIRVLSNCSNVNLTEVTNSNTTFIINQAMTKIGGQTFSYSFCNTSQIDSYSFSWNDPCIDCSNNGCGNSFSVTATGQVMTSAKATIYLWIFVISLLIFIGLLIIGIFLPSKNKSDQMTGYIIALENLKYLKFFCIMFAYLVALFITFFSYSVCYSYLDFPFLTSLTYFLFYGMLVCTLVFFPIMIYLLISNWIHDQKVWDGISRGLHIK